MAGMGKGSEVWTPGCHVIEGLRLLLHLKNGDNCGKTIIQAFLGGAVGKQECMGNSRRLQGVA